MNVGQIETDSQVRKGRQTKEAASKDRQGKGKLDSEKKINVLVDNKYKDEIKKGPR
jgi:hypothetical protein